MASRQSEEGFSEEVALECSGCVSWWHPLPAPRFLDAEGREDLGHGTAALVLRELRVAVQGWGGWQGRIGRALCQLREFRLILSSENA